MLPDGFRFSQTNLQDYVDCPRRFQLRYLESQVWPGVQVEPVLDYEQHMVRGSRFHRLVERHQLGIDVDVLTDSVVDDVELIRWWRSYLDFEMLHDLKGLRLPEFAVTGRVAGASLLALFDLVVVGDDRLSIFDWKTYDHVPSRAWFQARLQTRVYLFVMMSQGVRVFGESFLIGGVSLVYWVLGKVIKFDYSPTLFEADQVYLSGLLSEILARDVSLKWDLAIDEKMCGFCVYRSLCDRGIAGEKFDSKELVNIARDGEFVLSDDFVGVGF